VYPDLHRPEPIQVALLDPEQGPALAAQIGEAQLTQALGPTFADPAEAQVHGPDIWAATSRRRVVIHRLMHYIPDRRRYERRWVGALEETDVPLHFAWGMRDPVSGAHMAERIRERIPHARFLALDEAGHWPSLEAPEPVTEFVLAIPASGS
jgi:pimeloyl-ACP methyl ester carboxylesterase